MITTNKYRTVSHTQNHHDWSFLPILLNATAGVSIGLAIGNYLSWL